MLPQHLAGIVLENVIVYNIILFLFFFVFDVYFIFCFCYFMFHFVSF